MTRAESGLDRSSDLPAIVSVAIGQWAVAAAPSQDPNALGSCVGVVLYDRIARLGGLAHIVLPEARGAVDHPGKYADTAIPTLIADFDRRLGGKVRPRLVAKLVGGANMFQLDIWYPGEFGAEHRPRNQEAIEQILNELTIPIIAPRRGWNNRPPINPRYNFRHCHHQGPRRH